MRWARWALLLSSTACQPVGAPAAAPTSSAPAARTISDGLVNIGSGVSLHIHCVGNGTPVVVFDAGLGNDGSVWLDLLPDVGKLTRACVYDRAGMGYSSRPAPRPHTNRMMARELYALLNRAGVSGPYVMVGHSMGGMNVRLFASEHLDEVAGMVLVDAVGDDQPSRYWTVVPAAEMAEFREGLSKLPEGLDFGTYLASFADMRSSSTSIGDRPLVVLTHGVEDAPPGTPTEQSARTLSAWQTMEQQLAHLSTNSVYVVAVKSRHVIQWDAPQLVVASIRQVVKASRTHEHLDARMLTLLAQGETK